MKTARVIPCLDVTAGRVVKGTNFVDLRDAGDPVELAARYDLEGADELVFLDITASSDKRNTMVDVVRRTAEQVFMPLTVGGGVRMLDDIRNLLSAGADKVSIYEYNLAGNGKSNILGTAGVIKLIREVNGPVIGFHMIGSRAGEQVGEAQLIGNWEAYPEDVAPLIHAHPTMNEAIGEAHLALAGKPLHAHA